MNNKSNNRIFTMKFASVSRYMFKKRNAKIARKQKLTKPSAG